MACTAVSVSIMPHATAFNNPFAGIGAKATQSVLTAALLFAFKDVLYDAIVKARRTLTKKA